MNKYNLKPGDKVTLGDMSNHKLNHKYKAGDVVTIRIEDNTGFHIEGEVRFGFNWDRIASLPSVSTEPVIQLWPLNTLN